MTLVRQIEAECDQQGEVLLWERGTIRTGSGRDQDQPVPGYRVGPQYLISGLNLISAEVTL